MRSTAGQISDKCEGGVGSGRPALTGVAVCVPSPRGQGATRRAAATAARLDLHGAHGATVHTQTSHTYKAEKTHKTIRKKEDFHRYTVMYVHLHTCSLTYTDIHNELHDRIKLSAEMQVHIHNNVNTHALFSKNIKHTHTQPH